MSKKKLAKILDTASAVVGIALIVWVGLSVAEIGFSSELVAQEYSKWNLVMLLFGGLL